MTHFTVPRGTTDRWYRTQRLSDDITLIDEPGVKPFYRCNIWHVRGRDRDLVVDFGLGAVPLRKQVALLAERDITAIASHCHFDHIGAAHEFGCCHVHSAEAEILGAPDNQRTLADLFLGDEMFDVLPPAPYTHSGYRINAPANIATVEDGDVIDLGNRHFTVLHTPGHSPGGLSLWEADTRTLISGDVIYDGELIEDAYHSDLGDYAQSLRRLRELPVQCVHGGHFPSFSGDRLRTLIDQWLRDHQR